MSQNDNSTKCIRCDGTGTTTAKHREFEHHSCGAKVQCPECGGTGRIKKELHDLVLHVKKIYFDQIKSGEKIEEYREVKPYYKKRLEDKEFSGVIIIWGYPSRHTDENTIVFPWNGFTKKSITPITTGTVSIFGPDPVEVYAIVLNKEQHRDVSVSSQ
ncbi:MAG: hypothetical protein WC558_07040 [Patulibacter sp.]